MTDELDSIYAQFGDDQDREKGRVPFISEIAGTGEMLQATPEGMSTAMQSTIGGAVAGMGETARLGERAARLVAEPTQQAQTNIFQALSVLTDTIGLDSVSNVLNTLYGSEQNRTVMQALSDAYNKETTLPSFDEIEEFLKSKGLSFDDEGGKLVGEFIAPF